MSPTVLQSGPHRSFFFSSDRLEPAHVHIKRDDKVAKLWLGPIRQAYNYGFKPNEMKQIVAIARENEPALIQAWHDYFDRNDGSGGQER